MSAADLIELLADPQFPAFVVHAKHGCLSGICISGWGLSVFATIRKKSKKLPDKDSKRD
jgi:hypothetical protein